MSAQAGVVGRYEILSELGRGGTAIVYLARQTDLRRLVALKQLSLPVSDVSTARRFVRESRLAGSLNHPNIVTVHDFFERDGTPYIAMEYLERGSLRPLMHELTFAQVAGVLEGLLAGLGQAQEYGIVHRDLKPENLMVTKDGRLKIADFGIAKMTGEAQVDTALTVTGTAIGTPTYMAPEQAMARDIGPWTDMYAVGVIAFELLAGRPPFETTGAPMAVLLRHVNQPPPTLAEFDPSVDPRLSDWIDRLLVKDPEARRHSASSAWLAFEGIVLDRLGPRWRHAARLPERLPTGATPATMPMSGHEDPGDGGAFATARPRRPAPVPLPGRAAAGGGGSARRLGRAALLLMAVLVAVVVLAMATGNGQQSPGGSPASSPSGGEAAPTSPVREPARSAPAAPRSGVGDSQSDDPSDDEPDGGEP